MIKAKITMASNMWWLFSLQVLVIFKSTTIMTVIPIATSLFLNRDHGDNVQVFKKVVV